MAKFNHIGSVFKTNNYGNAVIIEYINSGYLKVRFENTGNEMYTSLSALRSGSVKDKGSVSTYGVGIIGNVVHSKNGVVDRAFLCWKGMLARCYDKSIQERQPSYKGCTVSDDFKHYVQFKAWFEQQVGWDSPNYQLDKDLLYFGNDVYSPNTCCVIPQKINLHLTTLPVYGCTRSIEYKKKFKQYCVSMPKSYKTEGSLMFNTYKEAFKALKTHKELELRDFAKEFEGEISAVVYEKLMNYNIHTE